MGDTGYCAYHPSREAQLCCQCCARMLCDRCVRVLSGEVYCSRTCQLIDLGSRWLGPIRHALTERVPTPWALAVVVSAAALLVAAISVRVAELMEVAAQPVAVAAPRHAPPKQPLQGHLYRDGRAWMLQIEGPPEASVLVISDGRPLLVIDLDEKGNADLERLRLSGNRPQVQLVIFSSPTTMIQAGPRPTPSPTATPQPTPTSTPTAVPTASPTPLPSRTAAATPRATATVPATPTATRTATAVARATATVSPTQPDATPTPKRQRTSRRSAPPILHLVPDAGPLLALTFDGGSSSNGTADLLDLLKRLDLKVTIFLTGDFIKRDSALVRRALAEGHEIGNHTHSHSHLTTYANNHEHQLLPHVSETWFREQLKKPEDAFYQATGRRMAPLWRAPYGEENSLLRAWALDLGYLHVRWSSVRGASLDSWDWVESEHSSLYQDSQKMVDRLLRFPRLHGGIALMHLASDRPNPPWSSLPNLVERLRERNIEPTTVTELLRASPTWRRWLERATEKHRATWGPDPTPTPARLPQLR